MNSEKLDNQLNLALDVSNAQREKTMDLDVGYDPENNTWELIVKYSGSLGRIAGELGATVVELMNEYAIITISQNRIKELSDYEEIEFIEKPRRLVFAVNAGKAASCINPLQTAPYRLSGAGILTAVIDSGIDYSHPDFRKEDGSTRILELWDQTISSGEDPLLGPPPGYATGTLYGERRINDALARRTREMQLQIVPSTDLSGHGTHVAGIAAGNGRASGGRYRGIAYDSSLLIVKLGNSVGDSFPKTTQLMEAIDYVIKKSLELKMPLAVNLSFGNSYGAHNGLGLVEGYINDVANIGRTCICIGTGNDGNTGRHAQGVAGADYTDGTGSTVIELAVSPYEMTFNLQLWKNYLDDFDLELISPGGESSGAISKTPGTQRFRLGQAEILLYYGEPSPYNGLQEIYFEFLPADEYVPTGVWKLRLIPRRIIRGNFDIWLPAGAGVSSSTRLLNPSLDTTLTIPSTAYRAITVSAYDAYLESYATFSGRGYTRDGQFIKPDIAAPGVNIMSASPGGGYTPRSGTSMATPFVTGSCALLMEWGIANGNDAYLYGEKMKAYLIKGARHLNAEKVYPNPLFGWGALCLADSLPR